MEMTSLDVGSYGELCGRKFGNLERAPVLQMDLQTKLVKISGVKGA